MRWAGREGRGPLFRLLPTFSLLGRHCFYVLRLNAFLPAAILNSECFPLLSERVKEVLEL